jgi:ketosteroid isomerase-like protein
MENDPIGIVNTFNNAINRRDVDAIAALITVDYTFIDSADFMLSGYENGLESWRRFFNAVPEYRNIFERVEIRGDMVVVSGRSECPEPSLDGPALWSARVRDGKIREWRVYKDTAENRQKLGL